jgi:hypothetical protein
MPFKPGQSGNPSGRNGQKPISDALKALLSRNPGKTLEQTVCDTNAQLIAFNMMVKALGGDKDTIKEVIDRTEGKPAQSVEHCGSIARDHEENLEILDNPESDDATREGTTPPVA